MADRGKLARGSRGPTCRVPLRPGRERGFICATEGQIAKLAPGKVVGCGTQACVYETGRSRRHVVKVTSDERDVQALLLAQGVPGVVRVAQSHQLLDKAGKPRKVWAVLVERLRPLRGNQGEWVDRLAESLDGNAAEDRVCSTDRIGNYKGVSQRQARACERFLAPLVETLDEIAQRGVVYHDLHAGNVMLDSRGRPTLVDLGYSKIPKGLPRLPTLARWRKRQR